MKTYTGSDSKQLFGYIVHCRIMQGYCIDNLIMRIQRFANVEHKVGKLPNNSLHSYIAGFYTNKLMTLKLPMLHKLTN